MVGEFDLDHVVEMARRTFGRFAFAEGPRLDAPDVMTTRSHKSLTATSKEFKRPLSEIRIAWNTGVRATDPQAGTLLVLGEYINKVLFTQLRERSGDSYTPEASFKADSCSGIFRIKVQSSNDPEAVERRIFEALSTLKHSIDASELKRFSDRLELKLCKDAQSNDGILECMTERVLYGTSHHDIQVRTITTDAIRSAARKFLPSYKSGYVRLALAGQ